MSGHPRFFGSVILVWLGALAVGYAQGADSDSTAVDAPATTPSVAGTASAGPGRQAFDQVFAQWKSLLKDLRDLQHRFTIAEEKNVEPIREQFLQKVEQGLR